MTQKSVVPRIPTRLTSDAHIDVPIICGAMYPCSNPELVAAASEAGGIGILQPISLTYVHGYDFRDGIRKIRSLTQRPIGMNALIEQSSNTYRRRMEEWIEVALEEDVRFFVTSLGKPDWVVRAVEPFDGRVYHDITERKWAQKGVDCGVHGLIAVNSRAGGHAGGLDTRALLDDVVDLELPVICAGGVGTEQDFVDALGLGYAGVQMGTRFIATPECTASDEYKQAIVDAEEEDIVLSERLTGIPVAVINTPFVDRMGLKAGPLARWMLRGRRTKHWMRTIYAVRSLWQLRRSLRATSGRGDYWQAGRSVSGVHGVESAHDIVKKFALAAHDAGREGA
jgi:nitronate monooxygenase